MFVPITPCRVMDTRPAFQVGPRTAPLGPNETYTVSAHGTNGRCTIPTDAVALDQPGVTGDGDAQCSGTVAVPTAPAGKVCIYLENFGGMMANTLRGWEGYPLADAGFEVSWTPDGTDDVDQFVYASWAYTAP